MSLSQGKQAVIKRAKLLTQYRWTPLCDVPIYRKSLGKTKLPAGEEVKGMLYSSPEPTDKFVAENISFESFRDIVANPQSALYTKDLGGHNNSWAYFGLVCNGFVRYCLDIPRRYSTKRWPTVPGMNKLFDAECYKVEDLEVGDVLFAFGRGRNHVEIVTGIKYDNGKVLRVEVSDGNRPTCREIVYTPEEFYEEFRLFDLCRYDYVDSVPMPSEEDVHFLTKGQSDKLPAIALDFGNKANYRTSEEVVISVFGEGENIIEIYRGDEIIEKVTVNGSGSIERKFDRGYYKAKLADSEVEFCVTEPQITYSIEDGVLTVNADSADDKSEILYMDFREKLRAPKGADISELPVESYSASCAPLAKLEELTEEEKASGVFSRVIPEDGYNFKIYFKNKYGVWTHTMISLGTQET